MQNTCLCSLISAVFCNIIINILPHSVVLFCQNNKKILKWILTILGCLFYASDGCFVLLMGAILRKKTTGRCASVQLL